MYRYAYFMTESCDHPIQIRQITMLYGWNSEDVRSTLTWNGVKAHNTVSSYPDQSISYPTTLKIGGSYMPTSREFYFLV